ncbi:MAG TPA: hypothetical protein DEH78_08345, partial [Solibacterales bacterium]|nr:hypothetical protein [Bryobacterales bacterium]
NGMVAFAVKQQEREVAIRMAVGASPGAITRLFLRQSAVVIATGAVAGLAGASALGRGLEGQLHGVVPTDPLTLGTTAAGIALAAGVAMLAPSRDAARTDPAVLLREE